MWKYDLFNISQAAWVTQVYNTHYIPIFSQGKQVCSHYVLLKTWRMCTLHTIQLFRRCAAF